MGGTLNFKSKSVSKFYEISETLDLCDIWRVRNRDKKKVHFPPKTLFWIYSKKTISNRLQESSVKAEALESFFSDYSSVAIKICISKELR